MLETIDRLLKTKNITMGQVYWLHNLQSIIPNLSLEQAIAYTKILNAM